MAIIKINNNAIDLDAAEIPNLDASKINTGSLGTDRIPNLDASKITTGTITPSDGTVTTDKIVDANVTLAKLSATGTKDATTFLRGDNTFAEAGGGKVLQVVQLSNSTGTTTTSTSYVTTPFAQAITPSLSSSKILCLFKTSTEINTANRYIIIKLDRDGTNLLENRFESSGTGTTSLGFNYLDSPATTSSVTYTVYFKSNNSDNLVVVNRGNELGSLILIEIGA
jgi:hypothetical protein